MFKLSLIIECLFLFSCVDNSPSYSKQPNKIDTVIIEKNIITKAKTKEGNFILYSDSTWTIDPEPAKTNKSKKRIKKPASTTAINPTVNPPSYNSYSAPTTTPVSTPSTYSSSSYSDSYSSTCGARTKKGGSCRRVVKGGGRCWQH